MSSETCDDSNDTGDDKTAVLQGIEKKM